MGSKRSLPVVAAAFALLLAAHAAAQETARFTAKVTGRGPDVMLLPGLASSGAVWDATVAQLEPTHRVHVLQVAGFAGLPPGANAAGPVLEPLVEVIADYAAALDQPALIGHSLGGLIGLEIAAARPAVLGRLMIVDALPFYGLVFSPAATVADVAPQAALLHGQLLAMSDDAYAASQRAGVASLVKTEALRAMVLEWTLVSDRAVVAAAMRDDLLTDVRASMPAIEVPTAIVYAFDPGMGRPVSIVDALYSGAYAGLAGATLTRIDGSYHFVMLDQPAAFAREVERFLH